MNVMLNRLDPHLPDPVESRRRAAGRLVRIAYSTVVFGLLAFFVIYFGRPLVYLGGPGIVSSPRFVVSLPYVVQVSHMNVTPGTVVRPAKRSDKCVRRSMTVSSPPICARWRTSPAAGRSCGSRLGWRRNPSNRRAHICS